MWPQTCCRTPARRPFRPLFMSGKSGACLTPIKVRKHLMGQIVQWFSSLALLSEACGSCLDSSTAAQNGCRWPLASARVGRLAQNLWLNSARCQCRVREGCAGQPTATTYHHQQPSGTDESAPIAPPLPIMCHLAWGGTVTFQRFGYAA